MRERTTSKIVSREATSYVNVLALTAVSHVERGIIHKGNPNSRGSENVPRVQNYLATGARAVLLGTAIIDICHLGTNYRARALIDSGSEATFITERLFNLIKLSFRHIQAQVSGLSQTVSALRRRYC